MGLGIYSPTPVELESILSKFSEIELRSNVEISISQHYKSGGVEVYLTKFYEEKVEYYYTDEGKEYCLLGLNTKEYQIESLKQVTEILIDDNLKIEPYYHYYHIGGTDQVPERLWLDFFLAYFRIFPDHFIWAHERFIFGLSDLEKIQEEGGYYEDWSIQEPRPIL